MKTLMECAQLFQGNANPIVPKLWLGNLNAANMVRSDPDFVVLNVREEIIPQVGGIQVAISDDGPFILSGLDQAVKFVKNSLKTKNHVLVHCFQGLDRSPMVVVQYLMKEYKINIDEAYLWVGTFRQVNNRKEWLINARQ